jgi:hypothetical protein
MLGLPALRKEIFPVNYPNRKNPNANLAYYFLRQEDHSAYRVILLHVPVELI